MADSNFAELLQQEKQLASNASAFEAAQEAASSLKRENDDLKSELKRQQADLDAAIERKTCDLRSQMERLKADTDAAVERRTCDLRSQMERQKADRNAIIELQTRSLRSQVELLRADVDADVKRQTSDLRSQMNRLNADIDAHVQRRTSHLSAQLAESQTKEEQLQRQKASDEIYIEELETKIRQDDELESQLTISKKRNQDLEHKLEQAEARVSQLEAVPNYDMAAYIQATAGSSQKMPFGSRDRPQFFSRLLDQSSMTPSSPRSGQAASRSPAVSGPATSMFKRTLGGKRALAIDGDDGDLNASPESTGDRRGSNAMSSTREPAPKRLKEDRTTMNILLNEGGYIRQKGESARNAPAMTTMPCAENLDKIKEVYGNVKESILEGNVMTNKHGSCLKRKARGGMSYSLTEDEVGRTCDHCMKGDIPCCQKHRKCDRWVNVPMPEDLRQGLTETDAGYWYPHS